MKVGRVVIEQDNLFDDITVTFIGEIIEELDDSIVLE